ncbi:hypothetical protein WAX74_17530 [Psychrobacillus sp. FJAT-51614]|uniref:Uncharacterized protein n=1 Tax=Psychrobacillus mangrovi TaxID=3117745 RepID=A0ABU8FBK0_9BACI
MITKADIINQPYSGQYKERIYDIPSSWNSPNWTWVKFEDENFNEWCGEFRGSPMGVALSKKHNQVLVLTSDYLFQVDCGNGGLTEYESQPQYYCLTVTPSGDFIIADYYEIEKIGSKLKDKKPLESPIKMDKVEFHSWSNNKLLIKCDEFLNWDNHMELELEGDTLEITIKDLT